MAHGPWLLPLGLAPSTCKWPVFCFALPWLSPWGAVLPSRGCSRGGPFCPPVAVPVGLCFALPWLVLFWAFLSVFGAVSPPPWLLEVDDEVEVEGRGGGLLRHDPLAARPFEGEVPRERLRHVDQGRLPAHGQAGLGLRLRELGQPVGVQASAARGAK